MKGLLLLTLLISGMASAQSVTLEEKYKLCLETCVAFEDPGFALRKCVSTCRDKFENAQNKFCETYEDWCGDDEGDVWGGL